MHTFSPSPFRQTKIPWRLLTRLHYYTTTPTFTLSIFPRPNHERYLETGMVMRFLAWDIHQTPTTYWEWATIACDIICWECITKIRYIRLRNCQGSPSSSLSIYLVRFTFTQKFKLMNSKTIRIYQLLHIAPILHYMIFSNTIHPRISTSYVLR